MFTITNVSDYLSTLFSNPSTTLAFLNRNIPEDFMEELARFASNRKKTTSAWPHHVVSIIIHGDGKPSAASIHTLGRHVLVVEVRFGTELPKDLT
jgi:hypothetical protein